MKITHIITGLRDGGAEAMLYRICANDSVDEHRVISLTDQGKYGSMLAALGVEVECLALTDVRNLLTAPIRLWGLLRRHRPDLVQTWMYHSDLIGGLVARLAGISAICWGIHNTTLMAGKSKFSTRMIVRLCSWLSGLIPARVICCAGKSAEIHRELGYAADKLIVIPNGYDLSLFRPDRDSGLALRREWQIPDDSLLFGMVGRYDPQKDHGNLLAALAEFKNAYSGRFSCVLVGTGLSDTNQVLCGDLIRLGLKEEIILLGQRNDIPAVMNALDIHVLSSAYGEAFPNVLAEAMACGTPCVTTDLGDSAQIVSDLGWVVPARDSQALAHALFVAANTRQHNESWQKRCASCYERIAENFTIERAVDTYRQVWQSSLKIMSR